MLMYTFYNSENTSIGHDPWQLIFQASEWFEWKIGFELISEDILQCTTRTLPTLHEDVKRQTVHNPGVGI